MSRMPYQLTLEVESAYNRRWDELAPVYDAYGFDSAGKEYVKVHRQRFFYTLDLIPRTSGLRILELGAGPYGFTTMMTQGLDRPELVLCHHVGGHFGDTVQIPASVPGFKDLQFPARQFNIESERWPLESGKFDVVLCMEILEHLLLDPYTVFSEARRVLAPGGKFILTTPNIASFVGLQAMLEIRSPYTYGVYSRNGSYGRHNREYVPHEIEQLGHSTGFDTELLTTRDFYTSHGDASRLLAAIKAYGDENQSHELRGQTIVYVGRASDRPIGPFPRDLYDFDPTAHRCGLRFAQPPEWKAPHRISLVVIAENLGTTTWRESDRIRLGVRLHARNSGALFDIARSQLKAEVAPGTEYRFELEIDLAKAIAEHPTLDEIVVDMVHEQVTWFTDVIGFNVPLKIPVASR